MFAGADTDMTPSEDPLLSVSRETRLRLKLLAEAVLRWNPRINLVSRVDESRLWDRHITDSAQLVAFVPDSADQTVDLGSGAGFPGLVLAIMTGRHVHLVESDQRKASFLREASRITGALTTVHAVRAETLVLPPMPLVTARAFAPLVRLLPLAARLLAPTGICLFPKGVSADAELTAACREWQMQVTRRKSLLDPAATILEISEIRRAPPAA